MKKLSYLIMLVFFVGFSCQQEAEEPTFEACGVQNPLKELAWLAERIASIESPGLSSRSFITQADYNEETIFIMKICCPNCNTVISAYNCEGTLLGVVGNNSEIDPVLIRNERIIWEPSNFDCSDL